MICATKLSISSVTTATACVFLHRFCRECSRQSGRKKSSSSSSAGFPPEYDAPLIVATCIYLAGKAAEEHVKIRDILNVTQRTLHPNSPPLEVGEKYWQYREAIVRCELFMIRMLGFNLRASLPHPYLTYHLRSLTNWIFADVERRDSDEARQADCRLAALTNCCWSILMDCFHSPLVSLDVDPCHLSIAVIYMGLECFGIQVPLNQTEGVAWYTALSDDITIEDIQDTVSEIIGLYEIETQAC